MSDLNPRDIISQTVGNEIWCGQRVQDETDCKTIWSPYGRQCPECRLGPGEPDEFADRIISALQSAGYEIRPANPPSTSTDNMELVERVAATIDPGAFYPSDPVGLAEDYADDPVGLGMRKDRARQLARAAIAACVPEGYDTLQPNVRAAEADYVAFSAWVNHPDKKESKKAWDRCDQHSKEAWRRVANAVIASLKPSDVEV